MEEKIMLSDKLKKIDEFAKSLGVTLYHIEFGEDKDANTHIISTFNISPSIRAKHPDIKSYLECLKYGNMRNSFGQNQ